MSLRETTAAFLATQLDFIFFFYGMAFILLGAVCFAVAKVRGHENSWIPLGLFGFVHGAGEWLDLTALVIVDFPAFAAARTVLMAGSFMLLMEFARQKAIRFGLKPIGPYLYVAMISLVALGGAVGGLPMAGALARYAIGFFAALAASWIFILHARGFSGATRRLAFVAAAGFALYAVAAGIIVPAAAFWPASAFNYAWFFQLTGIPIQLVRGLLACLLAFSVWAIWGELLVAEVSSERYTAYLRRQFIWTLTAMAAILMFGWTLTEFLGGVYKRNVEESAQGDIKMLAGHLTGETAVVDSMVRALAGSPSVRPLLTGGSAGDDKHGQSVLDLDVDASAARFGAILDTSGALIAWSDQIDDRGVSEWRSASWFRNALAGQAGSHFAFDPVNRGRYYYASYPVRRDDGSIAGVAVLQKSLDRLDADLRLFARTYFLIDPDGIVVATNRPDMMFRTLWRAPAESKPAIIRQFGQFDDRPLVEHEIVDASWILFDGEREFVRRSYIKDSRWSIVLAMPSSRIYASRILGIVVTLLVTMMTLIYFFGRERGIRDRIQMDQRVELQELAKHLRFRAATDSLTGLYNRAKFDESLASETARSERYKSPLALIMFDIDHFKQVNDVHGHQIGDDVLVGLAQIAAKFIRNTDLLARWGGEEFVILAPGLDGRAAYQTAEKLRTVIGETEFAVVGTVTCSFGVTQYFEGDTMEMLVARADGALYRAKMNGRNRTELASPADSAASGISSVA